MFATRDSVPECRRVGYSSSSSSSSSGGQFRRSVPPVFGSRLVHPSSVTPYSDALKFMGAKKEAFVCHNGHVKRPMNAFMVWSQMERQIIQNEILTSSPESQRVINNSEISCHLGKVWARLSEEERRPYVEEAERMRLLHQRQFPSYKYRPRKRSRQEDADVEDDANQSKPKSRRDTTTQAKETKEAKRHDSRVRQSRARVTAKPRASDVLESCSFGETPKREEDDCTSPGAPVDSPSTDSGRKRRTKVFSAVLSSSGALSRLKVFEIIRQNCSTLDRCKSRNVEASEDDAFGDDVPLKRRLTLKIRINEGRETKRAPAGDCHDPAAPSGHPNRAHIESPTLPDERGFGFSPSKPVGTDSFMYCAGYRDVFAVAGEKAAPKVESFGECGDSSFESTSLDGGFLHPGGMEEGGDLLQRGRDAFVRCVVPDYAMKVEPPDERARRQEGAAHDESVDIIDCARNCLSEDLEAIEFPAWWRSELSEVDFGRLLQDVQDVDDLPTACASQPYDCGSLLDFGLLDFGGSPSRESDRARLGLADCV